MQYRFRLPGTIGLVALPLEMAFAVPSGVSPEAGLYTAIVASFTISVLGGSKTQMGDALLDAA